MLFPPPQHFQPHHLKLVPCGTSHTLFSLCMERCDHTAVTMDHGVIPNKVVRESLGFSPWRGNPFGRGGGGGAHGMVPGCGRNDKQITLGQLPLIKAWVAHLTVHKARLDCDLVFGRQHKESGNMAARHLPIDGGQQRGVTPRICMVKLASGIVRNNHWVMWWTPANPRFFAGNLSTTLRRSARVRALELPGFN